jgi:serine/threonine protein kinase
LRGDAKVLDFGLAKLLQSEREGSETVSLDATAAGSVMGTVTYMSPEQALSFRQVLHNAKNIHLDTTAQANICNR